MKILAVYFNRTKDKIFYKPILIIKQEGLYYYACNLYGTFNIKEAYTNSKNIYSKIECVGLKNIKPVFYEMVIKCIFGKYISISDYHNSEAFEVEGE